MTVAATPFTVGATVARGDIPALCAGLSDLLRDRAGDVVICDVGRVRRPDVVTVEALARLHLTARRHGRRMVVRGATPALVQLAGLLGLAGLLAEPGRQPEQREQVGGVQEVDQPGDPPL